MATGLVNTTTSYLSNAYEYYLWTLSLSGMLRTKKQNQIEI